MPPALTLTGFGWALIPFIVAAVAAVAIAAVVWRRRRIEVGFDLDEAASYVWMNLPRSVKRRVALTDVVAVLEAEKDLDEPDLDDDAVLVATVCAAVSEREGIQLEPDDVAQMIMLQYAYAEEKGLM